MIIKNKILTNEDVIKLNLEPNSSVKLLNTIGQNPDVIEKISPNVKIQVLGPYDPQTNIRFAEDKYASRTFYSPKTLSLAIKKMEEIESGISPDFSEMEKALFVFDKLVKMVGYDYDQKYEGHNRNLESLTNNFSRCAGFSVCYKEMIDRLNIKNEFKNVPNIHSFNVLYIDNKKFVVDTTWARTNYDDNEKYLRNFGCLNDVDMFLTHEVPGEHVKYNSLKLKDVEEVFNGLQTKKLNSKPKNNSSDLTNEL